MYYVLRQTDRRDLIDIYTTQAEALHALTKSDLEIATASDWDAEATQSRRYVIVDDNTAGSGEMYTTVLPATCTAKDAIEEAHAQWERLTASEQRRRDGFFVMFAGIEWDDEDDVGDDARAIVNWDDGRSVYKIK